MSIKSMDMYFSLFWS